MQALVRPAPEQVAEAKTRRKSLISTTTRLSLWGLGPATASCRPAGLSQAGGGAWLTSIFRWLQAVVAGTAVGCLAPFRVAHAALTARQGRTFCARLMFLGRPASRSVVGSTSPEPLDASAFKDIWRAT